MRVVTWNEANTNEMFCDMKVGMKIGNNDIIHREIFSSCK